MSDKQTLEDDFTKKLEEFKGILRYSTLKSDLIMEGISIYLYAAQMCERMVKEGDRHIIGFIFDTLGPRTTLHYCYRCEPGNKNDDNILYISKHDVFWLYQADPLKTLVNDYPDLSRQSDDHTVKTRYPTNGRGHEIMCFHPNYTMNVVPSSFTLWSIAHNIGKVKPPFDLMNL